MVLYNWRIVAAFFFVIWAFFMIVGLPTDKAFGFGPASFGRMAEILGVPTLL